MTQTLTIPETLAAVRKALAENRLSAQHGGGCVYVTDDGYRCAIGACLTDETLKKIEDAYLNETAGIGMLVMENIVTLDGSALFYEALQAAHDDWDMGLIAEPDFVATLNALEAKYLGAAQ